MADLNFYFAETGIGKKFNIVVSLSSPRGNPAALAGDVRDQPAGVHRHLFRHRVAGGGDPQRRSRAGPGRGHRIFRRILGPDRRAMRQGRDSGSGSIRRHSGGVFGRGPS